MPEFEVMYSLKCDVNEPVQISYFLEFPYSNELMLISWWVAGSVDMLVGHFFLRQNEMEA